MEGRWTKKPQTDVVEIGGARYCKYCGKKPESERNYGKSEDGYLDAYTCDCQGAENREKIVELQKEQTILEHSANLILNPFRLREAISHITWEIEKDFPTT